MERIKKIHVRQEEMETSVIIDPKSKTADIYSNVAYAVRRMYELLENYPDDVKLEGDDEYGLEIIVPAEWIVIKPPRKYTEEQRQAMAERMRHNFQKKKDETVQKE